MDEQKSKTYVLLSKLNFELVFINLHKTISTAK